MKLRLLLAGVCWASTLLAAPAFPTVNSSTPLSVDSLVALGFEYSPSLRQTALDTRLNQIGMLNAIGNFLPTVSVGMSFSQSHFESHTFKDPSGAVRTYPVVETFYEQHVVWDTLGDQLSNPHLSPLDTITQITEVPTGSTRSSGMSLSLDESIFEGGRRYFLYRMAKAQKEINNLSVEDAKKSLAREIAQQVVLVITQEKLLDLNKKLRVQKQDAYNLAKARYDVGAVTELDVLQAQIALNSAENSITSSERDVQASHEALNQILGIDLRSSFPLEEAEGVTPFEFDVDHLVADAYANRTDLRIAGLTVERSRHNVNVFRSQYLPQVSLGAQWDRSQLSGTNEDWTLNPRNKNTSYSLSLRWNLFDGFTREYNVATQRVAYERAREGERQLMLATEKQVRDAYYNLEKVYKESQITEQNRDLAERQLNLERERYRLGATSQLSLRDAQFVYAQAETEHLQKTLEYQSTLIALELAVGKPLR
jgi:multidrug efflux system outer membrane protein